MPIEYLEHTADLGLLVNATTLEEAFCEAARGLFSLMLDVATIEPRQAYAVRLRAPTSAALLVEWLSDLLAQKELTGLVFSEFDVRVARDRDGCRLVGTASGETLDPTKHRPRVEVKGISYLGLDVRCDNGGWVAQCVLDV